MACSWREVALLKTGLTHKRDLVLYSMACSMRAIIRTTRGNDKMRIAKISLAVLSAFAINSYIPLSNASVYAASENTEKTQNVEVNEEKIEGKNYQVSKVLVHVKPEHIWHILTDYKNAPSVFPCLKKCKLVKDTGNTKLVEHQIKPSGVPGTFEYVIEVKEIVNRLYEWHRISGDFRDVDGFWKLEPVNNGNSTLVTYASYVNGGLFLPQPLIKRQVRTDIPTVMSALKTYAETARTIAGAPAMKNN